MPVASFTDAWIETEKIEDMGIEEAVASFTDAWIETWRERRKDTTQIVASFTDAWIETLRSKANRRPTWRSHPLRMRGLKLFTSNRLI